MVEKLLETGVDVNSLSTFFGSALTAAATRGHASAALLLLKAGAFVGHRTQPKHPQGKRHTFALLEACRGGHDKIVEMLLRPEYGWDSIPYVESDFRRCVKVALKHGHLPTVYKLRDGSRQTRAMTSAMLLRSAAFHGAYELVKTLLDEGASAHTTVTDHRTGLSRLYNDQDDQQSYIHDLHNIGLAVIENTLQTALSSAAGSGHQKIVELLLQAGAKIEGGVNHSDISPIFTAIFRGQSHMVRFLLDRGAVLDKNRFEHGESIVNRAFYSACSGGNAEMVRLLLNEVVDPNSRFGCRSYMAEAFEKGHNNVVSMLIEFGGEPLNAATKDEIITVVEGRKRAIYEIDSFPTLLRVKEASTVLGLQRSENSERQDQIAGIIMRRHS